MIIKPLVKEKLPSLQLLIFEMDVKVKESNPEFWQESNSILHELREKYQIEDISQLPANKATREAYKAFGKDPSRYRPSAEALLRRVINGKGLYQVNNVVDCLNLISVKTGFSIGGFDQDKIQGEISLSIGDPSEYEAIGRGVLNIEHLPTLFDEIGPFGNPTSDSMRTMVSENTQNFLMVIYDFSGTGDFEKMKKMVTKLYASYCQTTHINSGIIKR